MLGGDWAGPAVVAATVLATSLVLAVVFGLLLRPAVPGVSYGARNTVVLLAWLWASTFGADLTGHASALGMRAGVGVGTFPLTLTVVSLGAGIAVLRRRTAAYTSGVAALGCALRAAIITAVPLLVVSWACFADLGSLAHLADVDDAAGMGTAKVGASSVGSFFLTLVVVAVVLGAAVLARPRWPASPRLAGVAAWVAGPLRGIAALLVGLVGAGLVGALLVWLFHLGGQPSGVNPTAHQWLNVAAAVIVYAGNIGLWLLTLGAGGQVGLSTSTSVGDLSYAQSHGLGWWAGGEGINAGVWSAVVLAPLVLAAAAYAVARPGLGGPRERLRGLGLFVVSLLVVVPVLVHVGSLHAHAWIDLGKAHQSIGVLLTPLLTSALGVDLGDLGSSILGMLPQHISGEASAGPEVVTATLLVLLYAAVVSALVAAGCGLLTRDRVATAWRRTRERLAR